MLTIIKRRTPLALCLGSMLALTACSGEPASESSSNASTSTSSETSGVENAAGAAAVAKAEPAGLADQGAEQATPTTTRPVAAAPAETPERDALRAPATTNAALQTDRTGGNALNTDAVALQRPTTAKNNRPTAADPATFAVKLEPPKLNLGRIPTNEKQAGTVTLYNTGQDPITIADIKTSCGCTTAKLPKGTVLQPGESAEVEIAMKGGSIAGRAMNKTVTFIFEDQNAARQTLRLPVSGDVFSFVEIDPEKLDPDVNTDGRVTLRAIDDTPFTIKSMTPRILEEFDTEPKVEHVVYLDWEKWRELGQRTKLRFDLDHPKCGFIYGQFVSRIVNEQTREWALNTPGQRKSTLQSQADPRRVARAATRGDLAMLKAAMAGGEDVNAADAGGTTALMLGAKSGSGEVAQALLDAGAEINVKDSRGKTALMWASHFSKLDTVRVLVASGASVNEQDVLGASALVWASRFGDAPIVQTLIVAGADVNAADQLGMTPLIWAAGIGDEQRVEALVKANADLEMKDTFTGMTPLMHAARTGTVENLQVLVVAEADLEGVDNMGRTAIAWAAVQGTADKVQMLVKAGAHVEAKDNQGRTAADHARIRSDNEGERILAVLQGGDPGPVESGDETGGADGHEGHDHD